MNHESQDIKVGTPQERPCRLLGCVLWLGLWCTVTTFVPEWALAGGPFSTGATAAQTNILTILTPIAVIAVMALGVAAWFNKISWGWCVAGVVGIVLVFGAPQIVAWVRGMFGV
jgi:type IV secretion system protein VirB2